MRFAESGASKQGGTVRIMGLNITIDKLIIKEVSCSKPFVSNDKPAAMAADWWTQSMSRETVATGMREGGQVSKRESKTASTDTQ